MAPGAVGSLPANTWGASFMVVHTFSWVPGDSKLLDLVCPEVGPMTGLVIYMSRHILVITCATVTMAGQRESITNIYFFFQQIQLICLFCMFHLFFDFKIGLSK